MKVGIIYSFLLSGCIVLMSSCAVQVQTYDLSEEYAVSLHNPEGDEKKPDAKKEESTTEKSDLAGVLARNFYGGDLKRGGIWWAGKGISLEKGDEFIFDISPVVADSGTTNSAANLTHPFGATFPPLDLIKEAVFLKVSARAEGVNNTTPVLYLQFSDADGFKTNAKMPSNKIENSPEFRDYYFDLKDIYQQNEPEKHKVNGALVNNLQFLVNPGEDPGYTGKIYIREIKIIPAASVVK